MDDARTGMVAVVNSVIWGGLMDEWQRRQILERAYAAIDPQRRADDERKHQEWLERHRDPITGRIDLGEDQEIEQRAGHGK